MKNGKARWIWLDKMPEKDEYATFKTKFDFSGKQAVVRLVAETNYIAYLNGKRIGFGQFAGYREEKYYDELELSEYLVQGENELAITVWYEGFDSATHIDDGAGLWFSVLADGQEIAWSSKEVLSAKDFSYLNGRQKPITVQLGYTSGMTSEAELVFSKSREHDRVCVLKKRPVQKLVEGAFEEAKPIGGEIFDLGRETAGYVRLVVDCEKACTVTVSYGEYLTEGNVPRWIPGGYKNVGRDFSLDFVCKQGLNEFEQFFIRIAGRYLGVTSNDGGRVEVKTIGVMPYEYPVTEKPFVLSGIEKQIYDVSVRTLRLCMHEHYEDCPWREQALYTMDSRNQMLCGYYAFEETAFQRANLAFISKGKRSDGLLELTYPAVNTPAIPFFSIVYPVAVFEYIERTGDHSILDETWGTISGIMKTFADRIDETGLLKNFDEPFWNFYEWSEGSDNENELDPGSPRLEKHDLILNCSYLYALTRYEKLLALRGEPSEIDGEKIRSAVRKTFYDERRGLYFLSDVGEKKYSQLGNAFACLVGLGNGRIAIALKEDKTLIPATLSMLAFVYDALLAEDENNAEFVLNDIRKNYSFMLERGATSFWETLEGVTPYAKGCSLCHGWSAIPVYYYNILKKEK